MDTLEIYHPDTVATMPPNTIELFGSTLTLKGKGLFPYECKAKDKYPFAYIYTDNNGGWTHSFAFDYLHRDKSKDTY